MSTRESDPVKRAELHAARSILMGVDTLLSHAKYQARSGGSDVAATKIESARDDLFAALNVLVEALRTN